MAQDKEPKGKPDDPGNAKGQKPKKIEIEVNTKPVLVDEREMTGAEIKEEAISQGVPIQQTFILYLERANGTDEKVEDDQLVRMHPHTRFSAIAPDDNS